jgi:hypothetical protein
MTATTLVSAGPCSAYAYSFNKHKVNSLQSFICTVRVLKECREEFIAAYQEKELKGVWSLTGDDCNEWYELIRPEHPRWCYITRIFNI